jgi:two-component system OmpR family sensor kinase/two-component system sensor histidine kinase BaeS
MGVFFIVIFLGAVVTTVGSSLATRNAFTIYTTKSGQAIAESLADPLAQYYQINGNWQGVASVLESASIPMPGMGAMMGRGMGRGSNSNNSVMSMMNQRMILADATGAVVYDTNDQVVGEILSQNQIEVGFPIRVNNARVGTLIVTPGNVLEANSPAGQFLSSVNRAIVWSSIAAGLVALILGGWLFVQITAPLRKLSQAAEAIAGGDLSQRVDIRSKDELGRLGRSFNRMAENLSQAETQRKHMIADVAHELRTPLAVLQAGLEGMQDGVIAMDLAQVETLHEQTLLLNRLVGDLRLLSLMEAGELRLERQDVALADFLRKLADAMEPQAAAKGVQLELDVPEGLPDVSIDTDRMTQVLNNLVSNALRYTPAGGKITIGASEDPTGWILTVTDTGTGISPEQLELIFDRFYRADPSRSRSSGGSGLGLAIVKQLVEAHGGTVRAQSPVFFDQAEPYGSRFLVTLPK